MKAIPLKACGWKCCADFIQDRIFEWYMQERLCGRQLVFLAGDFCLQVLRSSCEFCVSIVVNVLLSLLFAFVGNVLCTSGIHSQLLTSKNTDTYTYAHIPYTQMHIHAYTHKIHTMKRVHNQQLDIRSDLRVTKSRLGRICHNGPRKQEQGKNK